MRSVIVLASLTLLLAAISLSTAQPARAQLWLIGALGSGAFLAARLLAWRMHAPPLLIRMGRIKLLIAALGTVVLAPFAGLAIGFFLLTALPVLIFLPGLFLSELGSSGSQGGAPRHHGRHLVERHA